MLLKGRLPILISYCIALEMENILRHVNSPYRMFIDPFFEKYPPRYGDGHLYLSEEQEDQIQYVIWLQYLYNLEEESYNGSSERDTGYDSDSFDPYADDAYA